MLHRQAGGLPLDAGEWVFIGHATHMALSSELKVPAGQWRQAVAPAAAYLPVAQDQHGGSVKAVCNTQVAGGASQPQNDI